MKLDRLTIENYGIHQDRELDLAPGLQLIYGPNEAGKSTLLNLLRHLLFGLPGKNCPYRFANPSRPLAASCSGQLTDGREFSLRRERSATGRDQLTGELDDAPLTRESLEELLKGASPDLYHNIFAFSQRELHEGTKSLEKASLEEALFGGGIGGLAAFRDLQSRLDTQLDNFFKPRGTKQRIPSALQNVAQLERQYRESLIRPREYEQILQERDCLDDEHRQREESLTSLRTQLLRISRLIEARPHWLRRTQLIEELESLSPPAGLTAGVVRELTRLLDRREELSGEIDGLEKKLRSLPGPRELDEVEAALLERAVEITRLHGELSHLRNLEGDLSAWNAELDQLRQAASDADSDCLATAIAQLNPVQRATARQLGDASRRLNTQAEVLSVRRKDLDARHRKLQQSIDQLVACDPSEVDLIEATLERCRLGEETLEQFNELLAEQNSATDWIESERRSLAAQVQLPPDRLGMMPVPLRATLSEFKERLDASDQKLRRTLEQLSDAEQQARDARFQLKQIASQSAEPDGPSLEELREHRDTGWRLLCRRYGLVKGSAGDQGAQLDDEIARWCDDNPETLPQKFAEAVQQVDAAAEARFARAEAIARQAQCELAVAAAEQRVTDLTTERDRRRDDHESELAQWRELWQESGITPLSPTAMLEWLPKYEGWYDQLLGSKARAAKLSELEQELARCSAEIAGFDSGLPSEPGPCLSLLESRLGEARQALADRRRLDEELQDVLEQNRQLTGEEEALARERADIDGQLAGLLSELGLPEAWTVDTLLQMLADIDEAQQNRRRQEQLTGTIEAAQQKLETFRTSITALCTGPLQPLAIRPPLDLAQELCGQLEDARQRQLSLAQEQQELRTVERMLGERQHRLKECVQEIEAISQRIGVEDIEVAVERWGAAESAASELREKETHLRHLLGEDWEARCREALQRPQEELETEQLRLDDQIKEETAALRNIDTRQGAIEERLKQFADDTRSVSLAEQLESARAKLASELRAYAPLVLTQTLMGRALKRFEEHHQPRMLARIGDLICRMTAGEYVALRRVLDEAGTLRLINAAGEAKTPNELSTGTREQLYLAIRLAFVEDYCGRCESLPVVMDDVLVNFDENRAQRTLQVLSELSHNVQILLMTCHRRTIELNASLPRPGAITELVPGSLDALGLDSRTRDGKRARRNSATATAQTGLAPALFPES